LPVLPRSVPLVSTLHYYSRSCAKKNLLRDGAACPGPSPLRCLGCSGRHYGWAKGPPVLAAARLGAAWERRATAATIAVSEACAEGNERRTENVHVVANSRIEGAAADQVAGLPDGPYIAYVGDLRPEKGVPVLLEAYTRIPNRPPLVIVGAGEVPAPYDELQGLHLLGERPHPEVLTVFARSLFAVVPSIWQEPFGLVVLEAMAAGTPVVASNTGGIVDLVTHDVNGLLAEVGNPSAFMTAMAALIDDPARRRRLGAAAARTADRFAPERMITEIERVYGHARG
ncbi:MAG: glycosyltransferase family 4 protein, partial [Actinomycetota bacterium]